MIRLQTLGGIDLRDAEGREVRAVLAQPKRLALLVYLAAAPPAGFHRRDRVLTLFWPERSGEQARASLSRALYFLRRELGEQVVLSRGDEIAVNADQVWCDTRAFEAALAERRHLEAAECYRGELLPGFFLTDAPEFEQWLESRRQELRLGAVENAWALAVLEEAAGRRTPALAWARRAASLAPYDEVGFRRLLALLDRAGDQTGALVAYQRFADGLTRDLEVSPSAETRQLIEAIRGRIAPAAALPVAVPLATSSPPAPSAPVVPATRRRRRTAIALGVATVLVSLLPVTATPVDPLRVEVMPLENRTGNPAFDRYASAAPVRWIEALGRAGIREVSGTGRSTAPAPGTLVASALERDGAGFRIQAWVIDVRRKSPSWAIPPRIVTEGALEPEFSRLAARIAGGVAALRNASHATLLPLAGPPPAFDAYQEFAEGVKLQSQGQLPSALQHFRWAAALDSGFTWPLIHAGLAGLNWALGDVTSTVDSLLVPLRGRREALPLLQRHLLDHLVALRRGDWPVAYRAMRAAAGVAPFHFGFRFANRANDLNRPAEAVHALTRPGMDSLYRENIQGYWYVLTFSLHLGGEHRTELARARQARRIKPESASALLQECRALAALGNLAAVRPRFDTLLTLPREAWLTPGRTLGLLGMELRAHGHASEADEALRLALEWYRERPAEERRSQEWRELYAEVLYEAGRWTEADTAYQSLTKEFRASSGYPDNALYIGRLGTLAARQGRAMEARSLAERMEALVRFQPYPGQEAKVFRARIAALLGDPAGAMTSLIEAYGPEGAPDLHQDRDFEGLRTYRPFQSFMRPKG